MPGAKKPSLRAVRERMGELSHLLNLVNATLMGAVAVAGVSGDSARALSALRMVVIEAKGSMEEALEVEREVWKVINGDTAE